MIDRQLQASSIGYDDIKKVHSIWVIYEGAGYKNGVANRYQIKEENLKKEFKSERKDYDFMNIIFLYPNEKYDEKDVRLQNLIVVIVTDQLTPKEKLEILHKQFYIKLSKKLKEEIENMSDMLLYFVQKGIDKGLMQGMEKGMEKGIKMGVKEGEQQGRIQGQISATLTHIKVLMEKHMSAKEAFDLLKIDDTMQDKILELLKREDHSISNKM